MKKLVDVRLVVATLAVAAAAACSDDAVGPIPIEPSHVSSVGGEAGGSDTTDFGPTSGSTWTLATIRGVVLGVDVSTASPSAGGDTLSLTTQPVPGATVEVHAFEYTAPAPGGSLDTSVVFKDLGIEATLTADGSAKFEYTVKHPVVITDGRPRPARGYWLSIIPPAGSPYARRDRTSVLFAEQFGPERTVWEYYLNRP